MTSPRSDTVDPRIEAAVDAVARRLAIRGDADDEAVARGVVAALRAQGWRPAPPRPAVRRPGGVPPNAEYLAAKEAAFGRQPESEAS
jgi:hypothetical protein